MTLSDKIIDLASQRDGRGQLEAISIGGVSRKLDITEERAITLINALASEGRLRRDPHLPIWTLP